MTLSKSVAVKGEAKGRGNKGTLGGGGHICYLDFVDFSQVHTYIKI